MSSHLGDQKLVSRLASEHPDNVIPAFGPSSAQLRSLNQLNQSIAGLHPWWSHHISVEDITTASPSVTSQKQVHYASLFPGYFDNLDLEPAASALFESLPSPTRFTTFVEKTLRPYLLSYPNAVLGEVGLDRSFRIPAAKEDPKSARSHLGDEVVHKKLTHLKTPIEHQLQLLTKQLELAFELDRNVSMHSVQAQGATVDLLFSLSNDGKWIGSKSKICMHSYGGSADTIARILRIHPKRLYFSFSTTINARLSRLEALIRAVPDDRLLLESDYNDVRTSEIRLWEILGIVCDAKGWHKEGAALRLKENWRTFSGYYELAA
ncbi:MAG: hypothetical protein CYPHOPRED_002834 [Cyphobasidiales sp. Tagirdzhanova-0007]|nr:MAG: hypothetical protein CYPHOPRED_002834 [Cyphobasidiales sp. Tagirdzhanova-0007]